MRAQGVVPWPLRQSEVTYDKSHNENEKHLWLGFSLV